MSEKHVNIHLHVDTDMTDNDLAESFAVILGCDVRAINVHTPGDSVHNVAESDHPFREESEVYLDGKLGDGYRLFNGITRDEAIRDIADQLQADLDNHVDDSVESAIDGWFEIKIDYALSGINDSHLVTDSVTA